MRRRQAAGACSPPRPDRRTWRGRIPAPCACPGRSARRSAARPAPGTGRRSRPRCARRPRRCRRSPTDPRRAPWRRRGRRFPAPRAPRLSEGARAAPVEDRGKAAALRHAAPQPPPPDARAAKAPRAGRRTAPRRRGARRAGRRHPLRLPSKGQKFRRRRLPRPFCQNSRGRSGRALRPRPGSGRPGRDRRTRPSGRPCPRRDRPGRRESCIPASGRAPRRRRRWSGKGGRGSPPPTCRG